MAKVGNVAEAMRKEVARRGKAGPTVRVRAIRRGFYGWPMEDIREPGQEFNVRIANLKPYEVGPKGETPKYTDGTTVRIIVHEGKKYILDSWFEDAKLPSSLKDDEDEEALEEQGEDVL